MSFFLLPAQKFVEICCCCSFMLACLAFSDKKPGGFLGWGDPPIAIFGHTERRRRRGDKSYRIGIRDLAALLPPEKRARAKGKTRERPPEAVCIPRERGDGGWNGEWYEWMRASVHGVGILHCVVL